MQGIQSSQISINIPTVSDTAWAVGGGHRNDFGGKNTTHFCTFLTGADCVDPLNNNFQHCVTRCFGYGFKEPAIAIAPKQRSIVDFYPVMKTLSPGVEQSDLWEYPKNCAEQFERTGKMCNTTGNGILAVTPNFNPQGFTFTIAGTGNIGFTDGLASKSEFNEPNDVAVDELGVIYVADTMNNAIRMITLDGIVTTLAGKGPDEASFSDGLCSNATFAQPKGLDVRYDTNSGFVFIVVADTGNHRIREIIYNPITFECNVRCFSGLCGNNTQSATLLHTKASPFSGYADGPRSISRFSTPESVAYMEDNTVIVADTGNFLIRMILPDGNTTTLAGSIGPGQTDPNGNPLPGCPPPCLAGISGFRDGNLTHAQFYNILDLSRGPNNTLWIVDEHRIRVLELPNSTTIWYGIKSEGRVSTMAGNGFQGHDDGLGTESSFYNPSGIFVTSDNIVHVVDTGSCRIRRLTPIPLAAEKLTCNSNIMNIIRPSGCTSYDQILDNVGMKVSRVEANIQYSYSYPYEHNKEHGKYIKNCVGTPPLDKLDKRFLNITGDNLVIDDHYVTVDEDSEAGMSIIVNCPSNCANELIEGNHWYSEYSSICVSAMHDGKLTASGGYLRLIVQRFDYIKELNESYINSTLNHGILSNKMRNETRRIFNIIELYQYENLIHTLGGHSFASLQNGCGYQDSQPANGALYNKPSGIATKYFNHTLSNDKFIYIADAGNHRIRGLSAVCTQICENQGTCIAHDTCKCKHGWSGIDCTKPICDVQCGDKMVCVGPNLCSCKPGWGSVNCTQPLCTQSCHNNGSCVLPDTCSCKPGWFDANCRLVT